MTATDFGTNKDRKFTEWPCWTCRHRAGPRPCGTYYCAKPIDRLALSYVEARNMEHHHRALGTENQLRGETANIAPECSQWSA